MNPQLRVQRLVPGFVLALACCLFALLPVLGQEAAQKRAPLSQADMAKLEAQKVLVTNETFRQSFGPYINSELPVFITSDAVLNAWHVLLEESVARLEGRQVRVLGELLRHLWQRLPKSAAEVSGNDRLRDAAKRRATLVLAVAMQLLGEPVPGLAKDLAALVKTEVTKIESARGTGKPAWLGAPDDGFMAIDYTRFAPRGFYLRLPVLQRYFRSVAWLQAIPFRVAKEEELLAALMTANALIREQPHMGGTRGNWYIQPQFESFFASWHGFIGGGDDWDLPALVYSTWRDDGFDIGGDRTLSRSAESIAKDAKHYRRGLINDQLAQEPSEERIVQHLQIRLLPSARLRDAVLFQQTTDSRTIEARKFPSGMEVATVLGSDFAENWMKANAPAAVVSAVARSRTIWTGEPSDGQSVYDEYLRCLASLVDPPEKDSPDFMRGEAWQRKSCGTLLAAWTQMRRIWVLQAKTNVFFAGLTEMVPGFVEPDPEFFQRLGDLAGRTLSLLQDAKALESNPEIDVIADLERLRDAFRRWASHPEEEEELRAVESDMIYRGLRRLRVFGLPENLKDGPPEMPPGGSNDEPPKAKARRMGEVGKWNGVLAAFADKVLRQLTAAGEAERAALLKRLAIVEENTLHGRWMDFIRMTSRIESLAQKQLRQAPFTEREREFIRNFGFTLARAMFYDSNSYESPRDDAMKIVDVFSGPAGYLHAGTGRPRKVFVLYPWQSKEVLCIGSVLPWHEFNDPGRLNDETWRNKLDGPADQRPPVPDWYAPLLGEQGMWEKEVTTPNDRK
jgi:Protein of unknown function (DUF3160)